MTKTDFRAFLRSREIPEAEWEQRRLQWLVELGRLYSTVEHWLDEFAEDGVTHEQSRRVLEEEHLGRYEAPALAICLRGLQAWMEPVGANIVGARGRVDLKGPGGSARLVLVPQENDYAVVRAELERRSRPPTRYVWKKATAPPDVRYIGLTEEVFLETLMQVVDAGSS